MKSILNGSAEGKFSVVANKKAVALAVVLLLVAVVAFVMAGKMSGLAYIGTVLLGFVFVIVALIKFIGCREYIYNPTHSRLSKETIFFDISNSTQIRNILESGEYKKLVDHKTDLKTGGGARLDAIITEDGKYAAYQLYVYVPYSYEPVTELVDVNPSNIKQFVETVRYCVKR
jgi:hypothetical protein